MRGHTTLANAIAAHTGGRFRKATPTALDQLRELGLPDPIVSFFRDYEPSECIEGQVRLWPIEEIVRENRDFVPGCNISRHGYIVFSTTVCGDAYCFDLNEVNDNGEPRIVIIAHDEDSEGIPTDQIQRLAKPIATNLAAFLQTFLRDELDEDCIYT